MTADFEKNAQAVAATRRSAVAVLVYHSEIPEVHGIAYANDMRDADDCAREWAPKTHARVALAYNQPGVKLPAEQWVIAVKRDGPREDWADMKPSCFIKSRKLIASLNLNYALNGNKPRPQAWYQKTVQRASR